MKGIYLLGLGLMALIGLKNAHVVLVALRGAMGSFRKMDSML
jgi:hypothetical protein